MKTTQLRKTMIIVIYSCEGKEVNDERGGKDVDLVEEAETSSRPS